MIFIRKQFLKERAKTQNDCLKLGHTKMWTVRTLKFETSRYKAAQTLKGIQLCSASQELAQKEKGNEQVQVLVHH